ncbi:MAG TPA: serine/threonine-protein kinase [Kofleriaceae bacterium]|jgi:serine/threonine-protein kinase
MARATTLGVQSGDLLNNYRLAERLEGQRSGACFAATHAVLPRRAAIKIAAGEDRNLAAVRLLREACMLDALQHPGVPRIYDAGVTSDRRPWFAREMFDGESVAQHLWRGVLEPVDVAVLVRDVADTLAYAHGRGVIHGDLHAGVVRLTPSRRFGAAITDWSEAIAHDAKDARPIMEGVHVAPEVKAGDAIDDRADVYALGVLAYMALTGVAPIPHVPVRTRRGSTPRELARLIDQMLAPDRFDRPSAAEVFAELRERVTDEKVKDAPRMRRPRWTPPLPFAHLTGVVDLTDAVDDGWAE